MSILADLRRRRDGYARYAALLGQQVEALEQGELSRFEELADRRDALARELDQAGAVPVQEVGAGLADPEVERLVAEIRQTLERCRAVELEVRERLRRLRDDTLQAIQALDERRGVIERYAPAGERRGRLDLVVG
ncbi:MAG TPA: hypothetical protein VIL13_06680 [Longimicrobiales bacterium]|jgi:septation ring formation regulator EzrA